VKLGVALAAVLTGVLAVSGCGAEDTGPKEPAKVAISSENLVQSGKLLMCAEIASPPQEFYDEQHKPIGSDVDTGDAIAAQLGLEPVWVNSAFDTIIASVKSGKCDIVLSGQFITPERQQQVTMIPYITAGQGLLVKKGNSENISIDLSTLCGKKVVVLLGGIEADTLNTASKKCESDGSLKIDPVVAQSQSDMAQQLLTGYADAIFHDTPINAYWANQYSDRLDMVPGVLDPFKVGISVPKNKPELAAAIAAALKNIQADGTYDKIRAKWGLENTEVPALTY